MAYGITQSAILTAASSHHFTSADGVAVRVVNGWSVEGWFKMGTAGNYVLIRSRSGESGWGISIQNTTGSNYVIRPDAGSGAYDGANSNTNINDGAWHHVRVYYNTSSTKVYIDGALDATVSIPSISNPNATVYLGRAHSAAAYFDGNMSLWRIWNNEHTTADQCKFYNGELDTNLKVEWSLNNTLADATGNGHTLTNVNSVPFEADVPATCVGVTFVPRVMMF